MKLYLASLLSIVPSALSKRAVPLEATPPSTGIAAGSAMGQSLLSSARRLENADDEEEFTWVKDYSLKFLGCHHVASWNADAGDDANDVRILTKRLVRFRLCPSNSCGNHARGCKAGYGDYVVDLATYAQAYWEGHRRAQEQECEMFLWKQCDCDDEYTDDKDDNFNKDYCEYDCYNDAGKDECIDRNPYSDDEEDQRDDEIDRYMECQELEIEDDDGGRRLEDEDAGLYVGPYCAGGGSKVLLGLFTDDTCTQFADDDGGTETYLSLVGETLPYSVNSIIGNDCVSCEEGQDVNKMKEAEYFYATNGYYEEEDEDDEDRVAEQCEDVYDAAGKCEKNLGDGVISSPVNSACEYIEGIRITYQTAEGVIMGVKGGSMAMSVWISVFAVSCAALGGYVYFLQKSKLFYMCERGGRDHCWEIQTLSDIDIFLSLLPSSCFPSPPGSDRARNDDQP